MQCPQSAFFLRNCSNFLKPTTFSLFRHLGSIFCPSDPIVPQNHKCSLVRTQLFFVFFNKSNTISKNLKNSVAGERTRSFINKNNIMMKQIGFFSILMHHFEGKQVFLFLFKLTFLHRFSKNAATIF